MQRGTAYDVLKDINLPDGPILEIGGPTEYGIKMLGNSDLFGDRQLIISNAIPQSSENFHLLAAAGNLPFADESLAVVMVANFSEVDILKTHNMHGNDELHAKALAERALRLMGLREAPEVNLILKVLDETSRVLKPGGILIWESSRCEYDPVAESLGFENIFRTDEHHSPRSSAWADQIWRK